MTESILDDLERYRQLDSEDMYRRIKALPEQMEDAWERAGQVELPEVFRSAQSVVVAGMGGSAIGGSLLEAYGAGKLPVPFSVWRGYGLPRYVGRDTLVLAVSYSGNTEETLSALVEARERGSHVLAITTDGQVSELANTWQVPMMTFQYDAQPRATLGYLFTPLVRIFERLGFLPEQQSAFDEALAVARAAEAAWGGSRHSADNLAKQIASDFHGRAVVVYGAEYLSSVARRWKTQLNENAKVWSFWEELPELNHNAIVGYEHPAGFVENVYVVVLSGSNLSDRVRLRVDVTQQLLDEFRVPWRRVEAGGEGKLAQMFSHIALGDYVSYYLALLNGANPTSIAPIDFLKESLARAEREAGVGEVDESGVHPGLTIPRAPEG